MGAIEYQEGIAMNLKRPQLSSLESKAQRGSGNRAILNSVQNVSTAFEVDNGKQLSVGDTVKYFVPPRNYVNLFTSKNHILLGSRGSGKTTWVRMLAHDHMRLAAQEPGDAYDYAREALSKNIIGIYIPTNIGFVGSLKNKPWLDEKSAENFFQWRLNLHSCAALIPIIQSCIEHYINQEIDRTIAEYTICKELSKIWSRGNQEITTLGSLKLLLSTIETVRTDNIARARTRCESTETLNDFFDCDLFQPIRYGIELLSHHIGIPKDALWMICIDEAEYLTIEHHRILNTHLRTASGNLVFKIATMPFAHHTLDTNTSDPIRDGHDFEYVYVDQVPIDSRGPQDDEEFLQFAREVFKRRIKVPGVQATLTLQELLGASPLIDEKTVDTQEELDIFMALLKRHANEPTCVRAEKLLQKDHGKFRSEILRKMHGALLLREALFNAKGNSKLRVYAGERTIVRCSDGNARRLVRLLNSMSKQLHKSTSQGSYQTPLVDPSVQNEVLVTIARDTIRRVQSEPPNGQETYSYLMAVGKFMQRVFSGRRLGSDFISSISVHQNDGEHIQKFVKQAVQLSLLTPARTNSHNGPNMPCEGIFHLAFLFSPLFNLLPRRNKEQRLPRVLAESNNRPDDQFQQKAFDL